MATFLTAPGPITAVWANTGEDKVTKDELRCKTGRRPVISKCWDGAKVSVFGARNEVVAFNLVLEAGTTVAATKIAVEFNSLVAFNGYSIKSVPVPKSGVFDWTQRDIELFYIRYLKINGLSRLSYETYDERHIPERLRKTKPDGGWVNRPDRNKLYPDIAIPIEAVPAFSIPAKRNQSIWVDVYIPKDAPAGFLSGEVVIKVAGSEVYRVPVELAVRNFTLPDLPSSKTMLATSFAEVAERYTGIEYPHAASPQEKLTKLVMTRQFLLAHRHKISLIDDDSGATGWSFDRPRPEWVPRLSGDLFSALYGYRGPGEMTGNNVYSIALYGAWHDWWGTPNQAEVKAHTDNWERWFSAHFPTTERFLYLIDESEDYAQTETWARWMALNSGPGGRLKSFATLGLPEAIKHVPSLKISASWIALGETDKWEAAMSAAKAAGKNVYMYNGRRPASGSFATEDDGVALRQLPWGQYKKGIDRWFFWAATYYKDVQGGRGNTNVFVNAHTFGGAPTADPDLGMTGWNYSNGDGVLFYPGIEKKFPGQSLNINGPIASLRLKHWRRGIQDVDYLTLAAAKNPAATEAIVNRMVPKVLWENGVTDPADPTWVNCPISWSTDPDVWDAARAELADIIEG